MSLICKCNSCGTHSTDVVMINPQCPVCGSHDCETYQKPASQYSEADLIHHSLSSTGIYSRN